MWAELPVSDMIFRREHKFQQGVQQFVDLLGDYELTPGTRLVDTTPESRMRLAVAWSAEMQASRLAYMGLA